MADPASVSLTIALARVWSKIRAYHPLVPEVVLLPAPNPHGSRAVFGHFAALRWQASSGHGPYRLHEVVVVAEYLNRSPQDIVGTLLHEAAHALNFERGIHDCSRSQYHNQHFKSAAEELGLQVTQVPHYGFAQTQMLPETLKKYVLETDSLWVVLMHRQSEAVPQAGTTGDGGKVLDDDNNYEDGKDRGGRYKKAVCSCPLNIRVSRKVMTTTVIRCDNCGDAFMFA